MDSVKKQCFISHCSDDSEFVTAFQSVLNRFYSDSSYSFFNTSDEETGSTAGSERGSMLLDNLKLSDTIIAFLTDSYVRSPICITELNSVLFNDNHLIPIVFSLQARDFLNTTMGKDMIYVDAMTLAEYKKKSNPGVSDFAHELAIKLCKSLGEFGYNATDNDAAIRAFMDLFLNYGQGKPRRAYIGSGKVYENIVKYCEEFGVNKLSNSGLPSEYVINKLSQFPDIYVLATTGKGIIDMLSSKFLPEALKAGTNITVLLPNKYSDFTLDVAEIEQPFNIENNISRLANEFDAVMNALDRCLELPDVYSCPDRGRVYIACTNTLLRQTITMGSDGKTAWGFLSTTIPPMKAIEGTPSFEFEGTVESPSMAKVAYQHVTSIIEMAKTHGNFMEITPETRQPEYFRLEKRNALEYWGILYEKAKETMEDCDEDSPALIEVAAQHPLKKNGAPGEEFRLRLDEAIRLYNEFEEGARIYVPGSLHLYKGKPDPISLCESGVKYLIENGIPEEDILGPEENEKYKGEDGLYNSADECYVASCIFKDGDYSRLHCVCSSNQVARKKLFYMAFGVIANFHCADADKRFHSDVEELIDCIPDVIYNDHTWQDKNSKHFIRTREERKPKE